MPPKKPSWKKHGKQHFYNFAALRTGYTEKTVAAVISVLGDYLRQQVIDAEVPTTLTIPGVGTVHIGFQKARRIQSPITDMKIIVLPPRKVLKLIPDTQLEAVLTLPIDDPA